MGRLKVDVAFALFAVVFINCLVQSQYYVEQPTHIYIVEGHESDGEPELPSNQFMSRTGYSSASQESVSEEGSTEHETTSVSGSQEDESDGSEEAVQRAKGLPRPIRLPPNFDAIVKRRLTVSQKQKGHLHGDPSPIHSQDDDRRPESRLLWPFSIEVSKGNPAGQYGSYTAWGEEGGWKEKDEGGGWGSYLGSGSLGQHPYNHEGWGEEHKGLSDKEIMKTKHYKKYIKKKKKIVKKLKKKLKFKRLIQKILQKHISYLDKIAPY